jgi:PPM family protein phosphatase
VSFDYAAVSEPGPRVENQDTWGAQWLSNGSLAVCVADGVGGSHDGARASTLAVSEFLRALAVDPLADLKTLALKSHLRVQEESQRLDHVRRTMATTLTAGVLSQTSLSVVHVGDSRALLLRGEGIQQLTQDQTEVARLLREGLLSRKAAIDYPRRNVLESAIGTELEPTIESVTVQTCPGDRLVLLTDGTHTIVSKRQIRAIADEAETPSALTSRIAETVRKRGAEDNFTILVVYIT